MGEQFLQEHHPKAAARTAVMEPAAELTPVQEATLISTLAQKQAAPKSKAAAGRQRKTNNTVDGDAGEAAAPAKAVKKAKAKAARLLPQGIPDRARLVADQAISDVTQCTEFIMALKKEDMAESIVKKLTSSRTVFEAACLVVRSFSRLYV